MKKASRVDAFCFFVGVDPDEAFGLSGPCFSNASRLHRDRVEKLRRDLTASN